MPNKIDSPDQVTAEWVKAQMGRYKITPKELIRDTGCGKTEISLWVNGKRPMSKPTKAMFLFYFAIIKNQELISNINLIAN